jgi:hypothetical protein
VSGVCAVVRFHLLVQMGGERCCADCGRCSALARAAGRTSVSMHNITSCWSSEVSYSCFDRLPTLAPVCPNLFLQPTL